jgi:hypothetical protein
MWKQAADSISVCSAAGLIMMAPRARKYLLEETLRCNGIPQSKAEKSIVAPVESTPLGFIIAPGADRRPEIPS